MKKTLILAKKYLLITLLITVFSGVLLPLSQVKAGNPIIIYNIIPTTTVNSVTITWMTDRATYGRVSYGKASNSYTYNIQTNPNQKAITQTITIVGLEQNTTYYFRVNAQDEGSDVTSLEKTFTTGTNNVATNTPSGNYYYQNGTIPATTNSYNSNCTVSLKNDYGFFGYYYNMPNTHPDMEKEPGPWSKIARQNDWYDQKYFTFSRIDKSLDFGDNFYPVNTGLAGDPYDFAVNWRGIIDVPQTGNYTYKIASDDDSWIFVDDNLVSDLNGIHMTKTEEKSIQLTSGLHKIEIFYADRRVYNAFMSFTADSRLKFHPLPMNCTIQDIVNYNNNQNSNYAYNGYTSSQSDNGSWSSYTSANNTSGQVLGASNIDQNNYSSIYVRTPDPKYTIFKAIYRTPNNPDIWVITSTNQRFYITSPLSFNEYGLNWNKIQTISLSALQKYPVANLVKLPNGESSAVYNLQQRAQKQWLRLLIPTGTVFMSYPNNYWGNVVRVNKYDMNSYPVANLIKVIGSSKVYLLSGSYKQPFANSTVFKNQGFNFADVVQVNQAHANSYLDGAEIR